MDDQNLNFHFKIIVITKKKLTINHVHYPYFRPTVKVQTGGLPSWCYYGEIEQYFAQGGHVLTFFRVGRLVRTVVKPSLHAINTQSF